MRITQLAVVCCLAWAMPIASQQLFAVGTSNTGPLYEIALATGEETLLGNLGFGLNDLATDRHGRLWGIDTRQLVQVDPADASAVITVSLQSFESFATLAVHPVTGVFFATTGFANPSLFQLNPESGEATPVGTLTNDLTSLAFDNQGRLFGSQGQSFFEIDPATGQQQLITDELSVLRFEDLAFHPETNALYGLGYPPYSLQEIDPATGESVMIGESVFRPAGLAFATSAMLLGDYNDNGLVDAADYTVWRDSFGSTTSLAADGNGDGVVDAADYTVWRDNFGAANASALGLTAVPEPATVGVWVAALGGVGLRRRR